VWGVSCKCGVGVGCVMQVSAGVESVFRCGRVVRGHGGMVGVAG
jgi:hypothetical protein